MIAKTPNPPYYAVIFTSIRSAGDNGYTEMAEKMVKLAEQQDGFLGVESAREEIGITVSYWKDLDSIKKWRDNYEHSIAREKGKDIWYNVFKTRISRVDRDYGFSEER
jgi:heme-degrading monooxygenase HmoA